MRSVWGIGLSVLALSPAFAGDSKASATVDFARDIRPILSDHCFACHGPDENHRAADLRLDTADGIQSVVDVNDVDASELVARIKSDDQGVVMPPPDYHKPISDKQQDLLRSWIAAGAPFESHWAFTPPIVSVSTMTDATGTDATGGEVAIGAKVAAAKIDAFIDDAVAKSGLTLNGPAPRSTLLRRLCLDLTGLPPTRAQIATFINDDSADAIERLIDELLASPHFGQHVGRYWLDLVRYADTHGLHLDNYREMWPYRDWVIDAFNANLPFDQFITKQLAGDLLPGATNDDRIASGYNRLNVTTNEGGSIYDEVFARNCMDRTDAFGTVFLGLTTGCAVCHDHKFDPISQKDYYSLLAFFNSLDGKALDDNAKDSAPSMAVPSSEQAQLLTLHQRTITDLQNEMVEPIATVDAAQLAWEGSLSSLSQPRFQTLHPSDVGSSADAKWTVTEDGFIQIDGDAADTEDIRFIANLPAGTQWQTLRLEAIADAKTKRVGKSGNGNAVLSEITIEIMDSVVPGVWVKIPITQAFADVEQDGEEFAVTNVIDGKIDDETGWAVAGHRQTGDRSASFVAPSLVAEGDDAKIRVTMHFQSKYPQHTFGKFRLMISDAIAAVPADQQITLGPVHTIGPFPIESASAAYDRSFAGHDKSFDADEVVRYEGRDYTWHHRADLPQVNVLALPTLNDRPSVTMWHQSIDSPKKQDVTLMLGIDDGYVVFLDGKEVARQTGPTTFTPLSADHRLSLKKGKNQLAVKVVNHDGPSQMAYAYRSLFVPVPTHLAKLVQTPPSDRSPQVAKSLQNYYRNVHCQHPDWLALVDFQKGARVALAKLESEIPTTLIWKELDQPRPAHLLIRGQYDQPGEVVPRGTPAFLPPFPTDAPEDRLGLAMWLTSPGHPLASRVAVNRFWQQIFGTGLVKTSEDFGSQGQPPSHPKLLDWLAVDFQTSGWDVKRLIKSLVTTRAYQRSAKVLEPMLQVDPDNRLLARGPRHRLDAEVLRDQSLSLAGVLVDRQGGPSVKPPQPSGLWKAVGYSGSNTVNFVADQGDKVYRRSVYVFWKRTSAPPQMSTLDAPSREFCTARRERTNTPLQALLLMNETQYVDAAKKLAERAMTEPDLSIDADAARATWLFQTVTARVPSPNEVQEMVALLTDMSVYYDQNPDLAGKFIGRSDPRAAAWTMLASTLLNLDETVSK